MDHARDICREQVGAARELSIHDRHADDLDAYINAACEQPAAGICCRKCKQDDAVIELMQTRSADEGMTACLVCRACGYRGKY